MTTLQVTVSADVVIIAKITDANTSTYLVFPPLQASLCVKLALVNFH